MFEFALRTLMVSAATWPPANAFSAVAVLIVMLSTPAVPTKDVASVAPEPEMVVKAKGRIQRKRTVSLRAPLGTRQLTRDFKGRNWV